MSNLLVVSNREPYEHNSVDGGVVCQHTDGGLVSALDPVLKRTGGAWVAWGSGDADHEVSGQVDGLFVPPDSPAYRLRRVWLDPAAVKNGGHGYANQVLWPLCHVTLDRVSYRKAFWAGYQALNRRFAETVLDELDKHPATVWIHDYHLGILPALIRNASPETTICHFWHVPWPGPDVLRILPERRELLEGLLAADCLTFQTMSSATAFANCVMEFLDASVSIDPLKAIVLYRGRKTKLTARAISVHFACFPISQSPWRSKTSWLGQATPGCSARGENRTRCRSSGLHQGFDEASVGAEGFFRSIPRVSREVHLPSGGYSDSKQC